jgi:glycosyltransferase involved in cell wall biosynthesis
MLTVVIASHNGAGTLPEVLAACGRLVPPPGGWKLVLVDNASTDGTGQLARSCTSRLPLVVVEQPRRGQNAARNTGLSLVEGDFVVFTDDDVLPTADWLVRLRATADAQPAFTIFGGRILPRWEHPPEAWIAEWVPLGPTFALSDRAEEGPVPPAAIFSPNMALRAALFRDGLRFDETIGPHRDRRYPMGSESELLLRLERDGHRAWYCPGAVVHHMIRTAQMERGWILRRAIRYGRGQYRLRRPAPTGRAAGWVGVPTDLLVEFAGQVGLVARAMVGRRPRDIFLTRWYLNFLWGQITEARSGASGRQGAS